MNTSATLGMDFPRHVRDISSVGAKDIQIFRIDPLSDHRWKQFVEAHPDASIFHSTEWLSAIHKTYGYESIAFVDAPRGFQINHGQVFCCVKSWLTGRRLVSVPFSDSVEFLSGPDESAAVLNTLIRSIENGEYRYFEVRPKSSNIGGSLSVAANYLLHRVDLRQSLPDIFHRFHKDCIQRKIRRAERENLHYSEGTDDEHLETFYGLLLMTHRRHRTPPQSMDWFRNLRDCLDKKMKVRIAKKDGRAIAAMITLTHGKTMTYKYGSSNADYHKMGGVPFLFWRSIQEAKGSGFCEFDMGRSSTDHSGLLAFKDHLGAQRINLNYLRYPSRVLLGPKTWEYRVAESILHMIPPAALRRASSFLYKHMG